MKNFILIILITTNLFAFSQNNAFKAFFWTQETDQDSLKHGCYGYNRIDSVYSTSKEFKLFSLFWLTYNWWHLKFKMAYMPAIITISKNKPTAITNGADHLKNSEWFTGFKRNDSSDSIRFYFPLLPTNQPFGRYDYFTIDVDSLLDLEFYGAGDSIMVGTFVHKKPDDRGAINILGRNAFIIELTNSNSLRIKSVRCDGQFDSLITLYLKYDLDSLKKDAAWYGIDILDTLANMPKVAIHSIDIDGREPHLVGSNKNITWKLEGQEEIDSCLITISYDKMSWNPLGKTNIDSSYQWLVPWQASDSTIIRVIVFGKHGEQIASIKENSQFFVLKGLQIFPSLNK